MNVNTSKRCFLRPSVQRWWIHPPLPDESLRSVLARAAAFHERKPQEVWEILIAGGPADAGSVDCPRPWVLARLGQALGIDPAEIFAHRLPDRPWQVRGHEQTAYCPICWNEDLANGQPIYLRRGWAHLLKMQCPVHDYPLLPVPPEWAIRDPQVSFIPEHSDGTRSVLALIDQFACEFSACAFNRQPWPAQYSVAFEQVRNALILANYSMNNMRDFSLTHQIRPSLPLGYAIHGPRFSQHAPIRLTWELFRAVSNPAHRRAAMWLVAWHTIPGLPDDLCPDGYGRPLQSGRFAFSRPIKVERGRPRAEPWYPERFFTTAKVPDGPISNPPPHCAPRSFLKTQYIARG